MREQGVVSASIDLLKRLLRGGTQESEVLRAKNPSVVDYLRAEPPTLRHRVVASRNCTLAIAVRCDEARYRPARGARRIVRYAMGQQKSYTKREVDRSFRKFNDLVEDLFSSPWQLWGDRLSHLMNHCEQDSVMRVVTEPLRTNKNVDVSSWYEEASKTNTGMTGSAYYELPINDDDKTSLLYQFMLLASLNRIDVTDFGESFFGAESPQEAVGQFNDQIVRLCTREVCYRLDENPRRYCWTNRDPNGGVGGFSPPR